MSGHDVLAGLRDLAERNHLSGRGDSERELRAIHEAVAELLAADKEYDDALARQPTQFLGRGYAKGMDRIERAKDRRQRALARCTGIRK